MKPRKFRRVFGTLFAIVAFVCAVKTSSASGAISIDATVSKDQGSASKTVATPAFSTTAANELLLAFISTDYISGANTTVTGVAGAGLSWTLVARANGQSGTSEIWRTFAPSTLSAVTVTATLSQSVASSLTVVSFSGADPSGTNGSGAIGATKSASAASGAPTVTLVTTRNGSWVFGVGNDFDKAVARTPGANQSLVHQYLTSAGDTYWVQSQNAATPASGTSVSINDTAPTGDRYNLSAVEILAAQGTGGTTYSISGTVSPVPLGTGVTLTLSGASSGSATSDGSGNFMFANLANGTYTVTPSKAGLTFNPPSQNVTITSANVTGVNFTVPTWTISGNVSGTTGVTMTLSGASSGTAVTDGSGNYSFLALLNGVYTVTPSKAGFSFNPASLGVTISGANGTANFAATAIPTYTISGTVNGATGVMVMLSGASGGMTMTDTSGNYSFPNLSDGSYTVTPSKSGFTLSPTSQPVTISDADVTVPVFTATAQTYSISGTISPAAGGAGATVALTGTSTATVTADPSGNYSFPSLTNGSYNVTPSNTGYTFNPVNQPVTISGSSTSGVNFTAQSNSAPATLSMDVNVSKDQTPKSTTVAAPAFSTAAPNELLLAFVATDYLSGANTTVTGISGAGLTWVLVRRTNAQSGSSEIWRAFSAAPLSNVTVTATLSQSVLSSLTVVSFTGADPTGTNGAGAIGSTASGSAASGAPTASLVTTRNNSWVFGVGNDFDNALARTAASGQTVLHQDLTANGDTYWVQQQNTATPLAGTTVKINDTAPTADRYNLSIVEVMPALSGGAGTIAPLVSMLSPAPGVVLANKVTLAANANGQGYAITGVQFLLDGNILGAQVTTTPYSMIWDSTTVTPGVHNLSATAYSSDGLNTISTPVSITVDNSGNAAVVGSWSSVVNLPAVAVNLVLLKTNKVLFYQDGSSPTVWDYLQNTFTSVPAPADLFCSGHSVLADGRVLVVGGYGGSGTKIGIPNAEIFDPSNNTWTAVPKMSYSRWYPTATTLSDGRVMVTAGWQTTNHSNAGIPEIYDPATNSWTKLTNANNPFETYPFLYQLSDGRVIHVGGSEYPVVTDILNISTQSWSTVDGTIVDGSSASMYLPGKIMKAGSASDSQGTGPASNTTYVLDTTQASPIWQQTPSMVYPRSFLNLTTLPDGTVLATGGETDKNGGNIANAVYAAELWSPQMQTWTTMSSMHTPREYHATALLLPDARVLVSGMGADFDQVPNEMNAEFYSPPYLFKGARPSITQSPAQVTYGQNFFVATPDGATISSAVLIRTGAVTHFFDQNTRFVPVTFQQASGGLTVQAPAAANLAPPGYYMLFIVNANGVPSVAPFVQLQ